MAHIYIITGETGAYDEYTTWNVGAFLDKISCSNYLNKLNQHLIDNNIPLSGCESAKMPSSPFFDSKIKDYWRDSGVEYKIEELQIFDNK
jgi:hypothetical protein